MGRGLSSRMIDILRLMAGREKRQLRFITARQIAVTLMPFRMSASGPIRVSGERFGLYYDRYRSVWRTLRLLEGRGLIRRGAKLKRGGIGWRLVEGQGEEP